MMARGGATKPAAVARAGARRPAARPRPPAWPLALAAIAVLAWAWRLLYLARLSRTPLGDSLGPDGQIYWDWSGYLIQHGPLGRNPFFMGPLYAYVLALLRTAFHLPIRGVLEVQSVLGAASVALLADAARRLTNRGVGIAIGLIVALFGMGVFMDGLILMESLLFFLECLLLWQVVRLGSRGATPWQAAALGLLIGLLAAGRATAVLLLVPGTFVIVPPGATRRRAAIGAVALVAGFLAISAPIAWRNHRVSGEWIPFTYNFGYNLYVGNNPEATGGFVWITGSQTHVIVGEHGDGAVDLDGREYLKKTRGLDLGPSASSRYWAAQALEWARRQPGRALQLAGRKLLLLWNRREVPQVENVDEFRSLVGPIGLPFLGSFAFIGPLALAGLFMAPRRGRPGGFLVATVACVTAGIVPFFVTDRYRHHLVPAAVLLAALTLERLVALRRLAPRERAALLRMLALGAIVVFLPAPGLSREKYEWGLAADLGARWLEHDRPDLALAEFEKAVAIQGSGRLPHLAGATGAAERGELDLNLAIALTRLHRDDEALGYYERAVREVPDDAASVRALARAYDERGRSAEAASLYARLPGLIGGDPGALIAQGWSAARAGHIAEAEGYFADAVRLDDRRADAWAALVRLRVQLGRLPQAREALEGAQRAGLPAPQLHAHLALLAAVAGDGTTASRELAAVDPAAVARDPVLADVVAQTRAVLGR